MRAITKLLCFLGVLAFLSVYTFGQRETGTITGTVTDPSGAVVAGANVSAKSVATGATRSVTTNNSGDYVIPGLMPGQYDVTIEAPNFGKYTERMSVTVGSTNELSPKLKVAAAGTSVEVSAAAEAVEVNTINQQLSEAVTAKEVSELPTLTRNPYDLAQTAGNVSTTDPSLRGAGVSINGQRAASTDILLDGSENVDLFSATVGQNVPQDSVQEFSIVTSDFTAEYGRAGGGIINVATKSGTNSFHGTAYEFNRVSALAANTYDNTSARAFAQAQGSCDPNLPETDPNSCGAIGKKGVFTRNQFGYSIGGPVIKNKLFFFQSTEWTRIRSNETVSRNVVTPQFLAASDPATQAFFAGVPSQLRPGSNVTQTFTAADVNSVLGSTGAFGALAAANPTLPVLQTVNFSVPNDAGGGLPSDRYSLVGRADWVVSDKTTLYGRYALENQNRFGGTVAFSAYAGYDTPELIRNQNLLISLNHVFTPTIVSTTKVTYNRLNDFQPLGTNPVGPTLYFKGGSAASFNGTRLELPGYLPENPGSAIPFGGPQNLYQFSEDVSWSHGAHQFRFGGMYLHTRDNRVFGAYEEAVENLSQSKIPIGFDNFVAGELFNFQGAVFPQGKFPCVNDLTTGTPIVTPACTLQLPVGPPAFGRNNRYNDFAFYGQDSWKVLPRLTLNLGLRWEYYGVQHNQDPSLDSNFYFGPGQTIFDQIRSGSVQIGDQSPIGGLWHKNLHNFAPRVGFAWDIFGDGKTSLRGGYGIAYERNFGNVTFNVIQNPPNYAVISIQSFVDVPGALQPTPNNSGPLAGTGTKALPVVSLRAVDPDIKSAYSEFWNMSLERELTKDTLLSFDYTGSRGVHLYDIANINRPFGGGLVLGDARVQNRFNPGFGDINFRGANGFSYYNALNVGLRSVNLWHSGVQFKMNYTYSHAIDNLSSTFSESFNNFNLGYLDAFNPRLDTGNADFDLRHRFVVSGIWDVPWGKNSSSTVVRHVVGGWEFAPIFQVRSGSPYTIYDCNLGLQTCARWMPAGPIIGSGSNPVADPTTNNVFNTIDLASSGSATSANGNFYDDFANCTGLRYTGACSYPPMLGRNSFFGPSNWNMDLGIYKNFKVTERVSLQFRGELYNLFNHHNYYVVTDSTDFASASFITEKKGGPFPGLTTQPTATGADERRNVQFGLKVIF